MQNGLLKPLGALAHAGHPLGDVSDGMFPDAFLSACITQPFWLDCTRWGETHTNAYILRYAFNGSLRETRRLREIFCLHRKQ